MNDHTDIPYLATLRQELVRAVARRNRRHRQLMVATRLTVAAAVVAVAATVGVSVFGAAGTGPQNANAAILHRVSLAITPQTDVILHEQTTNTIGDQEWNYEFWQLSDPPYTGRVIKGGVESGFSGDTMATYDPTSNTIQEQTYQSQPFDDPVAQLRQLLNDGDAQIVGTTTIDGQAVYEIQAHSTDNMLFNGTIYVDQNTYQPVVAKIQQNSYDCGHATPCSGLETIHFVAYEYLPDTPANQALVSITAQHPDARVIPPSSTGTSTGATSTTPSAKSGTK